MLLIEIFPLISLQRRTAGVEFREKCVNAYTPLQQGLETRGCAPPQARGGEGCGAWAGSGRAGFQAWVLGFATQCRDDKEPFRSVYSGLECSPGRDKECQ